MHILSSFSAPYNDVKNVFNITFTFSVRVYTCTQLYCHTKSAITPMGSIACVHAFIVTMLEYLHHTEHHCCIILPSYICYLGLIQHTYNRCRVTYHLLSHYHLHQSCICILWPYFIQVLKSSAIAAVFCTGS